MYTIIDIETTGGNNKSGRITEIAAFLHDGHKMIDKFTSLINPGIPIPPFIKNLTGISDEMVADAPTFEEIASELDRFTANAIFVAHNVNFDYSFIKEEFRRIGRDFKRKTLCTVQLSRASFPGLASYSLGKITRELNIILENAHRAEADAWATVKLFEKIILNESNAGLFDAHIGLPKPEIINSPFITTEFLESIPDECGVVRFYDKDDTLIYIKRSPQILTAISTKLRPNESKDYQQFITDVHRIDFDVTGSALTAQLIEANEMLKHKPKFNHGRFSMKTHFAIFSEKSDEYGEVLVLKRKKEGKNPLMTFGNFYEGLDFIKELGQQQDFEFRPSLFQNRKSPFLKPVNGAAHNLKKALLSSDSYLIIDEASTVNERMLIMVTDGIPTGYGVIDAHAPISASPEDMVQYAFADFPEMEMIVRSYLGKNLYEKVIPLT
ncbi:hypothetical protein G3O08_04025 [Cryomorpha ignava]|uniref:Exonuclease domain-containing protein n=1 Tax=Cryomorpha ignava TaxID=101383 RepID=A0A7K3WLZ6_9FLAO|nr:exonuclease domain-containing protein [Cryomorpha ignava]NEN22673.1 hypothetical protein [Cryomorpha ignava]